jgi:hypothetical protein
MSKRILAPATLVALDVDILAMDREASSRTMDEDGHMHVADAPISKACVSPYFGREIVDWQDLGLKPEKIYKLLRDPKALEQAADTFNGKPLLNVHKPQTANDHSHQLIVGSVGGVYWDPPYLRAKDLHIWDGDSIQGVENSQKRQLSAAYRYEAKMQPGTYQGQVFDGRMVNIRGNHVALVPSGRAGSDVIIGDSLPPGLSIAIIKEPNEMAARKPVLSRKAALVKGALSLHLAPKMAQDATLDFGKILAGVTAKNFKTQQPTILARLEKATQGKLAQDADLGDVANLLTAIEALDGGPDDATDMAAVDPTDPTATPPVDPMMAESTDPMDPTDDPAAPEMDTGALVDFLKGKLSPEDHARVCQMVGVAPSDTTDTETADPASPDDADADEAKDDDETDPDQTAEDDITVPGKPATGEPPMTKTAMDAAINAAALRSAKAAEQSTIARLNGVREAERLVRPYVGELSLGMDSAEAVFRYALGKLGVKHDAVKDVAALPIILAAQPVPGSERRHTPRIAQDAATADAYAKRFPQANRLAS